MPLLTNDTVGSREDALIYLTECTLATIQSLAMMSRPPKLELERQISIAQVGINWCKGIEGLEKWRGIGRVQEIINRGVTVKEWTGR